eukprot:4468868-Prymnesium_polylepis.1
MGVSFCREMLASVLPVHGPPAPRGECGGRGGCASTFSPHTRCALALAGDRRRAVAAARHGSMMAAAAHLRTRRMVRAVPPVP